jgi:ubiquinone/menaquinone biosynthesis C-methylase UbiE
MPPDVRHPIVRERHEELLRNAFLPLGSRVLDLGTGATTLEPRGLRPWLHGSAFDLDFPFEDASFDHVLVHDVIRRLERPERALSEMHRVLRPGGKIDVLEPFGKNPLIAAQSLSTGVRGADRGPTTARHLETVIARQFVLTETSRHQAMPIHRVIRHDSRHEVVRAISVAEKLLDLVVPRAFWAYVHVRARKPS